MSALVAIGLCALVVAAVPLLFMSREELRDAAGRARRRRSPVDEQLTAGPAIEDVARSLRRLRSEVLAPAPGAPMARRTAAMAAYDDLLLVAARALGVPDTLSDVPPGTDREAERLRVEHLLREAGLVLE